MTSLSSLTSTLSTLAAAAGAAGTKEAIAEAAAQGTESFAQSLQAAVATTADTDAALVQNALPATSYLLPEGAAPDSEHKPSVAEFMKTTGTTFETATSVLYGVIGSNNDLRDWKAIMGSDNPLQAARQAVGAMYNSGLDFVSTQAQALLPEQTVAQSGNFAWIKQEARENLALVDGQGHMLRQLPLNEADIAQATQDFGFSAQDLNGLADQLDALNVKYQPGQVFSGSTFGADLRSIAQRIASGISTTTAAPHSAATERSNHASTADTAQQLQSTLQTTLQMAKAWSNYDAAAALDKLVK